MEIVRSSESRLGSVDFDKLEFGKIFSDHMFVADYKGGRLDFAQDSTLRQDRDRAKPVLPPLRPGDLRGA